jgi:bacterioferritin (cytochrome b1)
METIRVRFLAEFLNEMLAQERAGATLYRTVIGRSADEVMRRQLRAFLADTEHHERILVELIRDLSGEPGPASAGAMAVLGAFQASLVQAIEPGYRDWKDLETLLQAEIKCKRNWEILRAIGENNGDPAILEAVGRVATDEDRHVEVLQQAVVNQAPAVMLSR